MKSCNSLRFKRKEIKEILCKIVNETDKGKIWNINKRQFDIVNFLIASNFIKPILPSNVSHESDLSKTITANLVYHIIVLNTSNAKDNEGKISIKIISAGLTNEGLAYIKCVKYFIQRYFISILSLTFSFIALTISISIFFLKHIVNVR